MDIADALTNLPHLVQGRETKADSPLDYQYANDGQTVYLLIPSFADFGCDRRTTQAYIDTYLPFEALSEGPVRNVLFAVHLLGNMLPRNARKLLLLNVSDSVALLVSNDAQLNLLFDQQIILKDGELSASADTAVFDYVVAIGCSADSVRTACGGRLPRHGVALTTYGSDDTAAHMGEREIAEIDVGLDMGEGPMVARYWGGIA